MRLKPTAPGFLLLVLSLFGPSSTAFAVGSGGFENATFSSIAISQSNAVTAQGEEPAAISYNPAGIANLKGLQVESNMGFISVITHISKQSQDGKTQSSGTLVEVPTGYLTFNPGKVFNDRLVLGIGSDSPFGLSNKWDSANQAVRYTGYKNWLKMYTLKPTVAFKFTDWLSVGAGAMNYRVFNFGSVQAYPNNAIVPGSPDGQLRLNMSGSHWGWHFGARVKPAPKHQFGFYFRSPVKIHIRGKVKVERSSFAPGGRFESGAYSNLDLPMNMTWGYAFMPNPKNTIEADFGYTRWSQHNRLDVISTDSISTFDDMILAAISLNAHDYDDTFSIHLGGNHKVNDRLTLRAGTLFYTAAVPKNHLIPAVPDSNRLAFSAGLSYQINQMMALDVCYMNMIGLRRGVNNDIGESLGGSGDGKYTSDYNIFLISMRLMWEDLFDKMLPGSKPSEPAQKLEVSPEIK